jgi:NAD-dependent SIR2 family protein deacetylase
MTLDSTTNSHKKGGLKVHRNLNFTLIPSSQLFDVITAEYSSNNGHKTLAQLASLDMSIENNSNIRIITQNVDGLPPRTSCKWDGANKSFEAHGRIGLYKRIPTEDSDTDSESDDEEDRPVKLGSRR